MAKSLVTGYRFIPSTDTVYLPGNIHAERLLLITNVTDGNPIFLFSNPTLGFTSISYDAANEETAITLVKDCSAMSATDKLQIFIETSRQEFVPAKELIDPVQKLRVSQPENLIDTDFEYGLQSTKWETLQTVSNIPTVYSATGDLPVEGIESVAAVSGSKQIRVVTNTPHGLALGDPISVQGLTQYQAEGYFTVSSVPDSLTFFYELDVESGFTGDISGGYTTITPAKFFAGSALPLDFAEGVQSDEATTSTLLATTQETHGFTAGTKVYLRNTVGPKNLIISNPAANAPDGRPYVDNVASFSISLAVDNDLSTGRGTFREPQTVSWDWESTYTRYVASSDFDPVTDTVNWPAHGFQDRACLLFNTPVQGATNGGLVDGYVYYVKVVDADKIQLHTSYETQNTLVQLSAIDDKYGPCRLGLVYKVETNNGTTRSTAANVRSQLSNSNYYYTSSNGSNVNQNISSYIGAGRTPTSATITQAYSNTYYWGYTYHYVGANGSASVNFATTYPYSGSGYWYGSFNATPYLWQSAGTWYITHQAYSPWGLYGSAWMYMTVTYSNPAGAVNQSGTDLVTATWGLGNEAPSNLIAFQGRTPASYSNSAEDYSFLTNQRTNGRYGTLSIPYTNKATSANLSGSFVTDYNDPNFESFGNSSEIFYVFTRSLTSDRNTIFSEAHGITSTIQANVTINSSDYAAGERFAYADANGNITQINSNTFPVNVIPVTADLVRIQTTSAPNTDNIVRYPRRFTISYVKNNAFYNTVFVLNHKITGTENAVYSHSTYNVENFVEYSVTNNGTSAYTFTTTDTNMDGAALATGDNPTLTLYRGVTYHFTLTATGHPFYIKTSATTGTGNQYTTGVTGNGTETGVVLFTVPEAAPSTLYYVCGNHAAMSGTINILEMPNNIGSLSFGQTYSINRVNDSRLGVTKSVASTSTALTTAVGYNNNNTVTEFIDIETALGLNPTSASITEIQFRGDFSDRNEYLYISFTDGSNFFIGETGSDGQVWQTETKFATKNITSLLTTVGGKKGFYVTIDPTSTVNFSYLPGGKFWELRFRVSGDSGAINFTSSGTGEQKFSVPTLLGAYDGVYRISSTPTLDTFEIDTDFNIPRRRFTVTSALVDNVSNSVNFSSDHNLITGERISYSANGNTNMFDSVFTELYAIVVNSTTIKFAPSYLSAVNNDSLNISPQSGIHYVYTTNVIKGNQGSGFINTVLGSTTVTGSGTRFLSTFKRFDSIWIEESGICNRYLIAEVTTDEDLELFTPATTTGTGVDYFFATQMILRPDGFALHKPFDGGVDITAGTSPNSKIVRQSRKYFRYQSGKGIQNSLAINFNPPRLVGQLTSTGSGIAQVDTQEVHNLKVGDTFVMKDAVVSTGQNTYNGTFTVVSVPNPFRFTYNMGATPSQTKAGGYPVYYRASWNDAYVRCGMFDDQNGFFFEYDGQKMYCVRRSSTQQIGGVVHVERGSQVVQGSATSFITQLSVGNKLVIRGQSYRIVEISSDERLVIQPAYRGVDAQNVKATVTVDVRVPQEDWSIDPCDGTGPTGFILNVNKIQMAYADYSWYGAGKIRFGWKDQNGEVKYVHEFKHNNRLDESYFRSGNLPGRYEIENGPNANHAPTLFHFGTSIIMDGTFDNDKAYLFTAQSKPFAFTNGTSVSFSTNAASTYQLITLNGRRVWVYALPVAELDAKKVSTGTLVRDPSNTRLPEGTYVTQVKLNGASSLIYTSYPATATEPGSPTYTDIPTTTLITAGETTTIDLTRPLPLISIRLAPSVDSSLTGAIGEREIINRMQLQLRQAGVTSNQDILLFLILNALPSSLHFSKVQTPSLSQLIEHNAGETLLYGTTIYSLKASAGSTEIDLTELLEMGNSILGGDSVFPAGPDILTLAVQPQNTSGISGATPFFVSGKISWSESQA